MEEQENQWQFLEKELEEFQKAIRALEEIAGKKLLNNVLWS